LHDTVLRYVQILVASHLANLIFQLTKSKISSWKFSVTTVKKLDIWLSNVQNKVEEHLVALKAEIEVGVKNVFFT